MKTTVFVTLAALVLPMAVEAEELIIWSRGEWGAPMVEGFNEKMKADGRDVVAVNNYIGHADFPIKFTAALSAGERVDVASIDLINVPFYASQGALEDITDFLKEQPYYDTLNQAQLHLGTIDGRHFAAPNAADVSGFVYNKKLLTEMGFDGPPENWGDMLTMCEAFAKGGKHFIAWPGANAGGQMFTVLPMAWANGGSWVSEDGKSAELDHPKTVEMFEHYRAMMDLGCVPENVGTWQWGDKQDAFLAGTVGMIGTGNFMVKTVEDHLDKVDPGFAPFMSADGSANSAFVGGDLVAIPATTGNKELAIEFIQYVLSQSGQVDVYTKNGGIPIRSDFFADNPHLTDNHLVFANASEVGHVPFTVVYQELMNPWLVAAQEIWAGGDINEVLAEGDAAMQRIIDAGN
ncbi:MAG: sugar ABC transporter substrate-binding protein [Hyphomicrobiales bacterium]|nr:sugar ABC transporter substrate-binding protein [Hyphomicrobiales bacterium]